MRRLFTPEDALQQGVTRAALRWGERQQTWRRAVRGVYADGPEPLSALDLARAKVIQSCSVARGRLAGVLHDLDSVRLAGRAGRLPPLVCASVMCIDGVPCAEGTQTMIDLAAVLDDATWEQAVECALRRQLTTIAEIDAQLPALGRAKAPGTARIRRVLDRRPRCVVPTGSLLETAMVQVARGIEGLPDPVRQLRIENEYGEFVAFVDLAWPELGIFIELDGQHHKDQPVYDSSRETAVVGATGWLCGRSTWHEVIDLPAFARRRLARIVEQARLRPIVNQ